MKGNLLALFILVGTILGAGIFGIPYAIIHSGSVPALFYFIILGFCITCFHLMFGEIILRNKGDHRLIYYAEKYLGKKGELLAITSTFVGLTGSLLAYIILGGSFLYLLSFQTINPFFLTILFWAILSFFVLKTFNFVSKLEVFLDISFFIIIAYIFSSAWPIVDFSSIPAITNNSSGLAYGVILYSLFGCMSIPTARKILLHHNSNIKYFKKTIILAGIITVVFSSIFGFIFAGITGLDTTPNIFEGLASIISPNLIALTALFGALLVSTSFLIISFNFIDTLDLDLKFNRQLSKYLVLFLPIALFLIGLRDFISIIGILGIVFGTIDGMLIIFCYKKAKQDIGRKPEYSLNFGNLFLSILAFILIGGATCYFLF